MEITKGEKLELLLLVKRMDKSHQEDNYQTDEPRYQKRREEDTCLITVDYSFDTN